MPDVKAKLLIVDDDVTNRKQLALLFSELGYCVRSVRDGISALSEIRHEFPDILLSEINMTGMSGVEFLLAVRHLFPSIQVIAMSGAFFGTCVPTGVVANAFFEKGSDPAHLIKAVRMVTQLERTPSRPGSRTCSSVIFHPGEDRSLCRMGLGLFWSGPRRCGS
jgi:CheY-like chemotaxis protein